MGRSFGLHSLLYRVVLGSLGFIGVVMIVLIFSIDYFVSGQFEPLRRERMEQAVGAATALAEKEKNQTGGVIALLLHDLELANAIYYHLYLEGERAHPQNSADRIAGAFDVENLTIWDAQGRLVARAGTGDLSPEETPPLATFRDQPPATARSELLNWRGEPWLVAVGAIWRDGNILAYLQASRRFERILSSAFPPEGEISIRIADESDTTPAETERRSVEIHGPSPLLIDVRVTDTVGAAVRQTKTILLWVLAGSGLVLAVSIVLLLSWQLRPVREVTAAAAEVGKGRFDVHVPVRGSGEVADLAQAFNTMADGLRTLRKMERQLAHHERLSAIGRVAARVAHDINNPLTVVRNAARLLRHQPGTSTDAIADINLILHHTDRSIAIVENLLNFGKPTPLKTVSLDLERLCRDILARWQLVDPGNSRSVSLAGSLEPLSVAIDPMQFEQAMWNILDNAHEAGKGSVSVEVGNSRGMVFVRITDNGPGFSPEAREHLFEPFFTTKTGGTGLGLASASLIVRAHGGEMEIADGPPGRITIRLPLNQEGVQIMRPGR